MIVYLTMDFKNLKHIYSEVLLPVVVVSFF